MYIIPIQNTLIYSYNRSLSVIFLISFSIHYLHQNADDQYSQFSCWTILDQNNKNIEQNTKYKNKNECLELYHQSNIGQKFKKINDIALSANFFRRLLNNFIYSKNKSIKQKNNIFAKHKSIFFIVIDIFHLKSNTYI